MLIKEDNFLNQEFNLILYIGIIPIIIDTISPRQCIICNQIILLRVNIARRVLRVIGKTLANS